MPNPHTGNGYSWLKLATAAFFCVIDAACTVAATPHLDEVPIPIILPSFGFLLLLLVVSGFTVWRASRELIKNRGSCKNEEPMR